jgi:PAS domain-containing protein
MNKAPTKNNRNSYSPGVGLIGDGMAELFIKSIMGLSLGCVITECYGQKKNRIVFVNQAFQEITGFMAKEVLGKSSRFLLGKDSKQKSLEQIRDAIQNGRQCTAVVRNFRKDGSLF